MPASRYVVLSRAGQAVFKLCLQKGRGAGTTLLRCGGLSNVGQLWAFPAAVACLKAWRGDGGIRTHE